MKLTIRAKSPAGYETTIEEDCADLGAVLDLARELEMQLARRGYTPTHPRQTRPGNPDDPQVRRMPQMIIHTITYRRVVNLGRYETETLELQAAIEDESPAEAYDTLKMLVHDLLGVEPRRPIEQTELR